MDHTVLPAINTMPAFYLVGVHQMAPPSSILNTCIDRVLVFILKILL